MIVAILLTACTSLDDVQNIGAALTSSPSAADTGSADTGHAYDSGIPDEGGETPDPDSGATDTGHDYDSGLPDVEPDTGGSDLPDTGVVDDPEEDTGAASTGDDEIPGRYLLETAYHVMQLNGIDLVHMNKVLEDGVEFMSLAQESCSAGTPTFEEMIWLEFEDCPFAAGWGWQVDYSSCSAPGGALYAGQLAFTFPLFAELGQDANPVDLEAAQQMTLDRGTDSSAIFYYSLDLGGPTFTACGQRSGQVLRPTVTGTMTLEEEGSVSMTGTFELDNILSKSGRAWTVTRTGVLEVDATNVDGEPFAGRIELDGVRHRTDNGFPDRGFVRYDDPTRTETGQVMFSGDTALAGTAAYSTLGDEPIETSFEGLH